MPSGRVVAFPPSPRSLRDLGHGPLQPTFESGITSLPNPSHDTTGASSAIGAAPVEDRTSVDYYAQLYRLNLDAIEKLITQVCWQQHASVEEEEDFRPRVHIKLMNDGYAVLREHKREASLRGFLTSVIRNAFRDYRDGKWGKWRPSKEAEDHLLVGVLLDKLVTRDGYTFDQAVEILTINHRVTRSRDELWAIFVALPIRLNRRAQGAEALTSVPSGGFSPEDALISREQAAKRAHAYATLVRVLREFPVRERLIVKLIYDGVKRVDIARRLGEKEKGFHARCDQLLARVRRRLEEEGVDPKVLGL